MAPAHGAGRPPIARRSRSEADLRSACKVRPLVATNGRARTVGKEIPMTLRTIREAFAVLAVGAALGLAAPAFAQGTNATSQGPANQGGTTANAVQGPASGSNPTASSVSEEQLFQQLDKLTGRVSIPDGKAAILEQPQGRDYRGFREGILPWLGGIFVIGM